MKLSMIVTITSLAPKRALSTPGNCADDATAEAAATRHAERMAITAGVPAGSASPMSAARKPPLASWLSAPMLNSPARMPNATASPVNVSVVAL